ncbi:MAG: sigma 54-interacting transcriptional regulator [Syntrophomonadaceae bacterium]|nr:sigma 54-interacting transcriptional regulator [Syntrophomonadaceae bacterium]MDD4550201.1 sigma 54-interacting transcriptional regulator [Syntrophomonadaceae bacterium]
MNIIQDTKIFKELNAIMNASDDGIFVTDGQGCVIYLNKACERIDNVKAEYVIGKNMKDLIASGYYSESVALKVLEKGSVVNILQTTINGKEIMATGTPIKENGEIIMVVVNARDITELIHVRKKLEEIQQKARQVETEVELLRKQHLATGEVVFRSPLMQRILSVIIRIATFDSTILIEGESGVGKEVISKLIHRNSKRKDGPFIKIDCSSIPENLLESELFGYEKGAFTGANKEGKMGLIELANKGTLFLDEIGELSLMLQAKLLRTIQDREIVRLGGKGRIPVDIRIIAATNKNLAEMVEQKTFREDLYYRLNVVPIYVPPLRDRKEDIYPLILSFVEKFNHDYGLAKSIDQNTIKYLLEYSWPGNVRQLANVIERILVTTESTIIDPSALPLYLKNQPQTIAISTSSSLKEALDEYEKKVLLEVMKKSKSTHEMAKVLEIDASTIRRKLKKHRIKISFN